jgi:hypothetical protein
MVASSAVKVSTALMGMDVNSTASTVMKEVAGRQWQQQRQ